MKNIRIAFIVLAIFAVYFMGVIESFKNGLTNLSPGEVPSKVLLDGWYPTHKPQPMVSDLNEQDQYKNYPIFPAHSTLINNFRQWRKPTNGKCVRADMCGDFYDDREVTLPENVEMPGFDKGLRVNFYNTC